MLMTYKNTETFIVHKFLLDFPFVSSITNIHEILIDITKHGLGTTSVFLDIVQRNENHARARVKMSLE